MKNILTILRDDLHAIRTNVMTAVIIFGLAIIPLLFTSFNVLASWILLLIPTSSRLLWPARMKATKATSPP